MNKTTGVIVGIIAVVVIGGIAIASNNNTNKQASTAKKNPLTITGAGSSFAAPLYGQLGKEYKDKQNVTVNYQSIGSGAGVTQFIADTVNFGGTDVALKDTEIEQAKAHGAPLNIPVAFGAVTVSYNVPGLKSGLKLDGVTVANIYMGKINNWNDAAIVALNPGVSLPDLAISPVYRSDSSGTTSQFTQFLKDTSSDWASQVGSDKTVKWPTGTGSKGNDGVAATVAQTSGSIGYVELAYALQNNFTTASVKNQSGQFVTPSLGSTSKAGENLPNLPDDLRFTAINSPADGAYPIASATFIAVYQDPCTAGTVKDAAHASALKGWLGYLLGDGQNSMKKLEYAPLASNLLVKAKAKVNGMTCNNNAITGR